MTQTFITVINIFGIPNSSIADHKDYLVNESYIRL